MEIIRLDDSFHKITKGSYEFKDMIKKYGGKWDGDNKVWIIPNSKLDQFKNEAYITKEYKDREKRIRWQKALDKYDFKYVNKGTKEYEMVLDHYKSL